MSQPEVLLNSGHVPEAEWLSFHLPIYNFLSYTLTLTLSYKLILSLTIGIGFLTYWLARHFIFTRYSRLPAAGLTAKSNTPFDLHPDASAEDVKQNRRYVIHEDLMDAFLASIKVFGYLDKHVLQELTNHLQTKKTKSR